MTHLIPQTLVAACILVLALVAQRPARRSRGAVERRDHGAAEFGGRGVRNFICRIKGHKLTKYVAPMAPAGMQQYTTCERCGRKWYWADPVGDAWDNLVRAFKR